MNRAYVGLVGRHVGLGRHVGGRLVGNRHDIARVGSVGRHVRGCRVRGDRVGSGIRKLAQPMVWSS